MKRLIFFFIFSSFLFIGTQCTKNGGGGGTQNTWKTLSPMPTARHHFGFVENNGLFYAIGGYDASGLNTVEVYDPVNASWQTKAPMPTARGYMAVAVVANKIYAIGGFTGSDVNNITYTNVTEVYDPATDQWTEKSAFPIDRAYNGVIGNQFITGTAINGKIYVAAGPEEPTYIYDPVADSWFADTALGIGKFSFEPYFSTAANNDMYVTDGINFLRYASAANNWNVLQANSTSRRAASLASDGTNIYSIGGYIYVQKTNSDSMTNDVGKYSISGSSWTKMFGMNVKKHSSGSLVYNGNLYVAGGAVRQVNSYLDVPIADFEMLELK